MFLSSLKTPTKFCVIYNDNEKKCYHKTIRITVPLVLRKTPNVFVLQKFVKSYNAIWKSNNELDTHNMHLAMKDPVKGVYIPIPMDLPVTSLTFEKHPTIYIRHGPAHTYEEELMKQGTMKESMKPNKQNCVRYGCTNFHLDNDASNFGPCLYHQGAPVFSNDNKIYWACCPQHIVNNIASLRNIRGCQYAKYCLTDTKAFLRELNIEDETVLANEHGTFNDEANSVSEKSEIEVSADEAKIISEKTEIEVSTVLSEETINNESDDKDLLSHKEEEASTILTLEINATESSREDLLNDDDNETKDILEERNETVYDKVLRNIIKAEEVKSVEPDYDQFIIKEVQERLSNKKQTVVVDDSKLFDSDSEDDSSDEESEYLISNSTSNLRHVITTKSLDDNVFESREKKQLQQSFTGTKNNGGFFTAYRFSEIFGCCSNPTTE